MRFVVKCRNYLLSDNLKRERLLNLHRSEGTGDYEPVFNHNTQAPWQTVVWEQDSLRSQEVSLLVEVLIHRPLWTVFVKSRWLLNLESWNNYRTNLVLSFNKRDRRPNQEGFLKESKTTFFQTWVPNILTKWLQGVIVGSGIPLDGGDRVASSLNFGKVPPDRN